jgi:hypothetical protein
MLVVTQLIQFDHTVMKDFKESRAFDYFVCPARAQLDLTESDVKNSFRYQFQ